MGEHTDKAKGKIKQATGKLTDDEKMRREGRRDEVKGKISGAGKDIKDSAKEATRDAKKSAR
ncbi:MAG: CsbD family protein [Thioalkalivibrio sp.]|nr:CsbD family protein [Thioalkalivibrio sp.]